MTDIHGASLTRPPGRSDADHNARVYLTSTLLLNLTAAFGDAAVLLPALALRLDAPSWLVTLPLVTQMSVAYVPVLFLGWLMRESWSRKRLYSISCMAMALTLVLLIVPLVAGAGRAVLLVSLAASWLLFALAQGVGVLPWWDLFARLFPPELRGRMLGFANAIGQVVMVGAAGGAAWLISDRGPLAYPASFAAALSIYVVGVVAYAVFILRLREPPPESNAGVERGRRPRLGEYGAGLVALVRGDPGFARTLAAAMMGAGVAAVSPLFLAFAQKHRGFTPDATSALVFVRPLAVIPAALLAGQVSRLMRPHVVVAGIAGAVVAGACCAPWCHGRWQFLPLLLTGLSPLTYHFVLVSIMSHAPLAQTRRYLTVYYLAAIIPGFAPMALGVVLDRVPLLALSAAGALAAATALMFWRAGRLTAVRIPGPAPSVSSGTRSG